MRSPVLIIAAASLMGAVIGLIGEALAFGSAAYLAALVFGMLVVSQIDRDRFWGADLRRRASDWRPRSS